MTIFDFLLACEWYKYQSDLHVIIFNHLQECCNSFVLLRFTWANTTKRRYELGTILLIHPKVLKQISQNSLLYIHWFLFTDIHWYSHAFSCLLGKVTDHLLMAASWELHLIGLFLHSSLNCQKFVQLIVHIHLGH